MKNAIITILFAFCSLMTALFLKTNQRLKNEKKQVSSLVESGAKAKVIKEYIRDSLTHVVFEDKRVVNNEASKRLAISKNYADSLEQALKISLDKIDQVTKVDAQLNAKVKLSPMENQQYVHQDKWLKMLYQKDSDLVSLSYDVGLNIARYSEKPWFLGKKKHFIDVYSDDPRVKIKGLQSFRIEEKKQSPFSLGIQVGYGIYHADNQIKTTPYIGLGLNYNLINF